MLWRYVQSVLVLTLSLMVLSDLGAGAQTQPNSRKTIQFINGQWFDGKRFTSQSFYAVDGMLTHKKPRIVEEVVDLQNGYVVPPYGDAHTHNLDAPYNIQQQVQMYLKDGIFYVKVLCNSLQGARAVADKVNIPASVDVKYAHGGVDGNNSHALMTYESIGLGYYSYQDKQAHKAEILKSRRRENDCYYIVDTEADLDRKWPLILAGKPDFIKVFLLHSEDYEKRKKAQGYGEGIDPKILPRIVARAHEAGLTVSAHVDSVTDYRNSLAAGVDEMAHMPGYYVGINENILTYTLSPEDARRTAQRRVWVTPTANLADFLTNPAEREKTRTNQIRNLKLLKDAGVKFSIGTDNYGSDSLKEALYLSKLGLWSNLEMLKMWCEDTPRHAFPGRKIGFLREGYEASFLVLTGNPLEAFEHVTDIRLRFKQGHYIAPPMM